MILHGCNTQVCRLFRQIKGGGTGHHERDAPLPSAAGESFRSFASGEWVGRAWRSTAPAPNPKASPQQQK